MKKHKMRNYSDNQLSDLNSTKEIVGIYWTKMPLWVGYVELSYLFVIMLIGIPGNSLIICVQSRNRDKSSTDYLIMVMAAYELVCCSLNASLKMSMNTKLWIYIASPTLCRFHVNVVYVTTFTSAFLLAAIAVDRYIKTCKPFSTVYNVRTSKIICVVAAFFGFLTGISGYFVEDLDEHLECNVAEKYMTFQYKWNMCIVLFTVVVFLVLTLTYANIAITLRNRVRTRKPTSSVTIETSSIQQNVTTLSKLFRKFKRNKVDHAAVSINPVATSSGVNNPSNDIAEVDSSNHETYFSTYRVLEEKSTQHRIARVANRPATLAEETVNRTTLMLFVLTIIYAITFTLTNIFVMTADAILGSIMVKLCKSLLMINCITNPICFFCMSSKYRASAKRLLFRRRST